MPDKLPKGWVKTTLEKICLPVGTIYPEDEPNAEFTYFDIGGIDGDQNRITETKNIIGRSAPSRARQAVQKGDILFSTVRTNLRKIARIEQDYRKPVGSSGFAVIRVAPGVSGDFIFQQVLSEPFLQPLHALQSGSSYPAVRDRDVFGQPVVLAPSAEQGRVITKLGAILSHVGTGEAAAERAHKDLKLYRAAVLHAAVMGELTRVWRKGHPKPEETSKALLHRLLATRRAHWENDELSRLSTKGKTSKGFKWKSRYPEPVEPEIIDLPELPSGWAWASVEQISSHRPRSMTDGPFGSHLKSSHYTASGPRVIRLQNIGDGEFNDDDQAHISNEQYQFLKSHAVFTGDIVIRAMGIPAPRACTVPASVGPAIVKADCIRLKVEPDFIDPKFAVYCLNAPTTQFRTEALIHGVGRPRLNLGEIKAIALPLPPRSEQTEIVRQVESRLELANCLESALESALRQARVWRQSILQTGFAGQLAQQSDEDESASVLLEKICAMRKALATQPKPKRGRKNKMKTARRPILEVMKEKTAPISPEELFAAAGFDEASVEAFFAELKELHNGKKIRERRDPHERGLVLLEVRS